MVGPASIGSRVYHFASPTAEPPEMEAVLACTHVHPFLRLQEVHYEPWREWDNTIQSMTDRGECYLVPA